MIAREVFIIVLAAMFLGLAIYIPANWSRVVVWMIAQDRKQWPVAHMGDDFQNTVRATTEVIFIEIGLIVMFVMTTLGACGFFRS